MQREIKFRAWDMDENKMIYPTLQHNEKFVMQLNCSYMGEFNGETYDTVKMPLMQFTGLHDKNGKDIYEGDIVQCHYFYEALGEGLGVYEAEKIITGQIVFQEMGCWIECNTEYDSGYLLWINGLHEESFEVIGNIYENPELL